MKRLIITEEEKRSILLKHGSKSVLTEAAKDDIMAIQKTLGLTSDGVAGPKTVSAILNKLGGGSAAVTTQSTTVAVTTQSTTVAVTTQSTTVAGASTKFSAVPVAGAATLDAACGTKQTNKDFRLCKRVFKKTT